MTAEGSRQTDTHTYTHAHTFCMLCPRNTIASSDAKFDRYNLYHFIFFPLFFPLGLEQCICAVSSSGRMKSIYVTVTHALSEWSAILQREREAGLRYYHCTTVNVTSALPAPLLCAT